MRISGFGRYALVSCAALAMLAGCGGSQPPIGAPGAMPQTSALAARGDNSIYKVVYSFSGSPDGANPQAGLIDAGGSLYGTTAGGGKPSCTSEWNGCGTIFSITPEGKAKVLYRFKNGADGSVPNAGLVDVGGMLYGTTSQGGSDGCGDTYYSVCGTVFRITPRGKEKVLHRFGSGSDGATPDASLIEVGGKLYGTTRDGGAMCYFSGYYLGCGTVFSITPGGTEKVVHNFGSKGDGSNPVASLVEVNGTLYDTTEYGGAGGGGAVFAITTAGTESVLHSFRYDSSDGAVPVAALVKVKGTLYGTTEDGGVYGVCTGFQCGTVFSITPSGAENVLHSFGNGTDGKSPAAPLIAVNGTLYGTTAYGGTTGAGTIFSISTTGTEHVLYNFGSSSTDATRPYASLIDVKGTLYGTTLLGGAHGDGTVFSLKP